MKTISGLNEYGALKVVAVRPPEHAYVSDEKIADEWERLRFYSAPKLGPAINEHKIFTDKLRAAGAEVISLGGNDALTLDSIYARDALLVSPKGLILCHMGRKGRRGEPAVNASLFEALGYPILGVIEAPGTIEGGDIIWLDDGALAVGEGPRTNAEGIKQLQDILGPEVEVHTVPLPPPSHPEDVFHLMSMISPLDRDLALIYRPLMPDSFINWLEARGISFVEVPEEEFIPMGCNVLALGPRNILMLDRLPETKARLEAAGCTVDTYTGDEISRKGEGGPTCLTRPLVRGA
ncbi:dimethylarginine dimethylaminohydrolase family protein [Kordiimonas lipolytica]|uniref:arginine deiminase n=1 Tax=Kordiimonas lipolytica TaxID=1662421 RepID=A0ABV8U9R1_9PROT|nr:arginine deiminase family protein [Kordiimonas lipolytica]